MKLRIVEKNCTGCQLCQLACSAIKNGNFSVSQSRIRVLNRRDGREKIIVCHQCKSCKCLESCHYSAFKKNTKTGGIYIDQDECQACFACIDACPFGAVWLDHSNETPMVCDLCGGSPPCVEACPSEALTLKGDDL
jgi:Fe-S-cluster-containing hydrogenase component 2